MLQQQQQQQQQQEPPQPPPLSPLLLHQSVTSTTPTTTITTSATTTATTRTPDSPLGLDDEEAWLLINNNDNKAKSTAASTRRQTHHDLPAGVCIRRAGVADAPAIARLASAVFRDAVGFAIPPADLQAYLDQAYTPGAVEADVRAPTKHVFVATPAAGGGGARGPILGFVQLSENTTRAACLDDDDDDDEYDFDDDDDDEYDSDDDDDFDARPSTVELQRLYVRGDWHGRGIGRALAAHAEALARHRLGYRRIWLGVWEGNFRAQRVFEAALGYARVGEREFAKGRCVQIDWIMAKSLSAAN